MKTKAFAGGSKRSVHRSPAPASTQATPAGATTTDGVLDLQRKAGNRATIRKLRQQRKGIFQHSPSYSNDDGGFLSTKGKRWNSTYQAAVDQGVADVGIIEAYQAGRAHKLLEMMVEADWVDFKTELDSAVASSWMEAAFLLKAVASGRNLMDVYGFAKRIRGKPERWLRRNLSVVEWTTPTTAKGAGLIQQYGNSCGATTVQVAQSNLDPVYALWIRSQAANLQSASNNAVTAPKGAGEITSLAADQANIHNNSPHRDLSDRARPTEGAWVEGALNATAGNTGVSYFQGTIGTNYTTAQAYAQIVGACQQGHTVPIVVGANNNHTAHYCLVMRAENDRLMIHDPWNGSVVWQTKAQVIGNAMTLPSTHVALARVDLPFGAA